MHKDLEKIWPDVKWAFRMLIRNGDFKESGYGFDIFEKASGKLDLTPDYGKIKISIEYKGFKNSDAVYEIEMKHPAYERESFEIKVPYKEILVDDPLMQSRWIADAAEEQMIENLDFVFRSANETIEESSEDLEKDLVKDLLKGSFSKKYPSLLMFGRSEISGFDITVEYNKIQNKKNSWPGDDKEVIYDYSISGNGFEEKSKFLEIIRSEDSKEDIAKDIAKFLEYVLKEGGAL